MKSRKVTESEIIDVLAGNAEPELEARVRRAIGEDPRAAALHARWAALLATVRGQTDPVREAGARIRQAVMARIHDAQAASSEPTQPDETQEVRLRKRAVRRLGHVEVNRPAPGAPQRQVRQERPGGSERMSELEATTPYAARSSMGEEALAHDNLLALGFLGDGLAELHEERTIRRRRRVVGVLSTAASLFLAVGMTIVWMKRPPGDLITVEQVAGQAIVTAAPGSSLSASGAAMATGLWSGERLRLPVRITMTHGAQADLRLPDGSVFKIMGPANLEAEFSVGVGERRHPAIDVMKGRVHVLPAQGTGAEVRAGQRASLGVGGVTVSDQAAREP